MKTYRNLSEIERKKTYFMFLSKLNLNELEEMLKQYPTFKDYDEEQVLDNFDFDDNYNYMG